MHSIDISRWQHDHRFGQDQHKPGELRTRIVITMIIITAITTTITIFARHT